MRQLDPIEQHLLLEAVYLRYGYDFRQYAEASLTRRLDAILSTSGISDPLDLLKRVVRDKAFFASLLSSFTITTTEFFRDPDSFRLLRDKILTVLSTYPTINIWVAGCSTGEEVLSLAIMLKEENLYQRTTIFATDINSNALKVAREGIYNLSSIQTFTKNYVNYGGRKSPSDYYTADYGLARFDPALRENVVFSEHNLATDGVFVEAHLITCRNVMMYFSNELQNRVLDLFMQSLVHRGYFAMGNKESLRFSTAAPHFKEIETSSRIFQLLQAPTFSKLGATVGSKL